MIFSRVSMILTYLIYSSTYSVTNSADYMWTDGVKYNYYLNIRHYNLT